MASPVPNMSHDFARTEEPRVYSDLNCPGCSSSVPYTVSHGGSGCDRDHDLGYLRSR